MVISVFEIPCFVGADASHMELSFVTNQVKEKYLSWLNQ